MKIFKEIMNEYNQVPKFVGSYGPNEYPMERLRNKLNIIIGIIGELQDIDIDLEELSRDATDAIRSRNVDQLIDIIKQQRTALEDIEVIKQLTNSVDIKNALIYLDDVEKAEDKDLIKDVWHMDT